MDNLIQHFENITKVLTAKYEVSTATNHPGMQGAVRELFIKEFLESHLPSRAIIESGQIFDSQFRVSNQHDLVVYHGDAPKVYLGYGSNLLFIEGVLTVIEIKSVLTKKEYFKSLNAYKRLFELERNADALIHREASPERIPYYIFAYTGPKKTKTFARWGEEYQSKLKNNADWGLKYRPDCICILDKFCWFRAETPLGKQLNNTLPEIQNFIEKYPLFFFFLNLSATIPKYLSVDIKWPSYISESVNRYLMKNP